MRQNSAAEPMREAFASRLHEVVDHLARTAEGSTVVEVLEMADALSGLSVALERAAVSDAGVRDPLVAARVRGIDARQQLIERAGGVLRLSDAAERLGVTPQAVTGRRTRGTILAVAMPNGEWVYPGCQFGESGLVPGIGAVLAEFSEVSRWTQLAVLLASSDRNGGRSALDLLVAGDLDAARSIAATYGEQG